MIPATERDIDRILRRVQMPSSWVACWPFTGSMDAHGYHALGLGRRTYKAHRAIYQIAVASIPRELVCDHLCRNRRCVNPLHIEPVTPKENTRRGLPADLLRARHASQTHCKRGHPLGEKRDKEGRRHCLPCRAAALRRMRARAKASKGADR